MQNGQMTNYIMPTSTDLPPIRVFFEELGNVHGAYGAKGIGELPMDGPAPAIVNAVEDALGVPFRFDSAASGRYFRRDHGSGRFKTNRDIVERSADDRFIARIVPSARFHSRSTVSRKTVRAYPMERLLDVLRQQLRIDRRERRMRRRRVRLVLGADGWHARE